MYVAREVQGMFVLAKDRVIRNVTFAKTLRRDIQKLPQTPEVEESIDKLKVGIWSSRIHHHYSKLLNNFVDNR